jgi:hypothetical protein
MENSILEIVTNQKLILDKALKGDYIERTILPKAKELAKTSLIKVIIGPRRTGKSILSMLLLKDQPFAFLNLDDNYLSDILKETKNYNGLLNIMFTVYGNVKTILFDEIQNLNGWELFANRLHREGYNVFLTGSNAKLLSRELATHLTGRHFPIEVLPFSFKEYLTAKKYELRPNVEIVGKGELLNHLNKYMVNGGYPEIVINDFNPNDYLSNLFDSVMYKDVISKHKIGLPQKRIINLCSHAINSATKEFSYTSLQDIIEVKSVETVEKYLGFLEESYIIFVLNRFSNSTKKRIKSPKKFYVVDNGFISVKAVRISPDYGKLMENLVFAELLKRGIKPNLDLFYYKTRNNKEVDFVIRKAINADSLIQVSYDIEDPKTEKRETSALIEASEELNCNNLLLITWDREEIKKINGKEIQYIPLWKWLLYGNN